MNNVKVQSNCAEELVDNNPAYVRGNRCAIRDEYYKEKKEKRDVHRGTAAYELISVYSGQHGD
jgi:hypothetical protein